MSPNENKSSPFQASGPPPPLPATRLLRSNDSEIPEPRSAQAVFNDIIHQLPKIHEFTEILYQEITPEKGLLICRSLAESSAAESLSTRSHYNSLTGTLRIRIMPTELHDTHHRWVNYATRRWSRGGLLNDDECKILNVGVGTTIEQFTGAYANSSKEPDLLIRPRVSSHPRIVVESGWAESWPHLRADKDLWLRGSNYVAMVILLKWSKLSGNRVRGAAEVWTRGAGGLGLVSQIIPLFPEPPYARTVNDRIIMTRGQVFGQRLLPGRNASDELPLDHDDNGANASMRTTFNTFNEPYVNSSKDPDVFIRPNINDVPQIVVESGFKESWPRLDADKYIWLHGTATVAKVVLLKWSKDDNNKVTGTVEVWSRGATSLVEHRLPIFPEPSNSGTDSDRVGFTRREIFGQDVVPGQNPDDIFYLKLSSLRHFAREQMGTMGLTPA